MESEQIGSMTVRKTATFSEAQQHAMEEAMNTMGQVIPVVMFRQGNRMNLSGALTFGLVAQLLYSRSAKQRDTIEGVASTTNRPEDKKHSDEIASYVLSNRKNKFYLGTLSLNVQQPLTLYTSQAESKLKVAYLVLPKTAQISITDGQHRQSAIKRILDRLTADELQEFANESISVLITCEMDIDQIHQDFADASKTKPLPPGLLAVYDRRNPANRVVIELERNVPLFRSRIDSTSKTLSKNSSLLYTANHLRQFVKVFLTGSWQMGAVDFERIAHELLDVADGVFERELIKATEFLNYLAERIPVWRKISHLPAGGTTAAQIRDERQKGYLCLSAVGLVIIARIGHDLFKQESMDWKKYADRLAALDWSLDGKLWRQSGVVSSERKILSQQAPMRVAVKLIRSEIDFPAQDSAELQENLLAPASV